MAFRHVIQRLGRHRAARARLWFVLLLVLIALGVGAGRLAVERAGSPELLLARLPSALNDLDLRGDCDAPIEATAEQALAMLVQDQADRGCPSDERVVALLRRHHNALQPHMLGLLQRADLGERARVRASLALTDDPQAPPPEVIEQFDRGALSPTARERLSEALQVPLDGSDVLAFDPAGRAFAWRFANGDPTARPLLRDALARELERPTLAPSETDPGVSGRRAALVNDALTGLGLSTRDFVSLRARAADGYPLPEHTAFNALLLSEESCQAPSSDGCVALVIDLLEQPDEPDPFGEAAMSTTAHTAPGTTLSEPWQSRLQGLTWAPQLLSSAAIWVGQGEDPAGRLLGVVANANHSYGPKIWEAGQRGDPADVLRYGGGTPAATAVAAYAIGDEVGVPVEAFGGPDGVAVTAGGRAAWIAQCGPGLAPAELADLEPISAEDAVMMLRVELAALAMERGELSTAREWLAGVTTPGGAERALGAYLLACEGVIQTGLPPDWSARAARWAAACGMGETATELEGEAALPEARTCRPAEETLPPAAMGPPD